MSKANLARQPRYTNPGLHSIKEVRTCKGSPHDEPCYTRPRRQPIRRNAEGKCRRGAVAFREVQDLQDSTHLVVPKAPMKRLVEEIIQQDFKKQLRTAQQAGDATHTIAESYMTDLLNSIDSCASHSGRKTIRPKDLKLALRLRREEYMLRCEE